MDSDEFRKRGKEMIDFIADYMDNISKRRVTPDIEPGYLRSLVSLEAPARPENWDSIIHDVEDKIMPGITHWQHPKFHAYFPAGNSYPSILGDLLSSGLGINGFSWASSPACTELETIVLHWLGSMSGLDAGLLPFERVSNDDENDENASFDENLNTPNDSSCSLIRKNNLNLKETAFRSDSTLTKQRNNVQHQTDLTNSEKVNHIKRTVHTGGGVLLGSASECVLVSMLAARCKAISKYKRKYGSEEDGLILTRLVAYTSKLAHSCVEKAAMISLVKIRLLEVDDDFSLRGETLKKAIDDDIEKGLIPFYVCGTFGTTCCCSYDNIQEIGPVCKNYEVYLHVDAAYAGNALICDEFRHLMPGTQYVDSFSYNPNKWMLINYDCSCLWVRDKYTLTKALSIDPVYLQYRQMEKAIDYRNWGISLSRRFRSLKLWFTIRTFGVNGLQDYIRNDTKVMKFGLNLSELLSLKQPQHSKNSALDSVHQQLWADIGHVKLAKEFENMILSDDRFELFGNVTLGLVCFRLHNDHTNTLSKNLLLLLNDSGKIHMTPAIINDKYVIRFCVNAKDIQLADIESAWQIIRSAADQVIANYKANFFIESPKMDLNDTANSTAARYKRKTFSKMVSEPVKYRSLHSLSIKSFDQVKSMRKIFSHDNDDTL